MTKTLEVEVFDVPAASVEVTLPSGKKALMRPTKGRDQLEARKVTKGDSADELLFALIARATLIDGKPVVLEQVLDMALADCLALQKAFTVNFPLA